MGPYTVTIISVAGLVVWTAVLVQVWDDLIHDKALPQPVVESSIVALFSVLVFGALASLGFAGAITDDISAVFGGMWRSTVLACGAYALLATSRLRRRER